MTGGAVERERVPYSPIVERPLLRWPNNAALALWIVPNIEFFEYLPSGPLGHRDPYPRTPHPDILTYGLRDYGNRVGFWRMFDVLGHYDITATLSLNIKCYEAFPEILELCEARRYDVMCHGLYNSNYLYDLTIEEERAYIRQCIELFARLTGRQMSGWYSPGGSGTWNTPQLLAEAGLHYYVDIYHDDHPIPIETSAGRILTMPYSMDVNDGWNFRLNIEIDDFERAVIDQIEWLCEEGARTTSRMTCLALHPYVLGQPHRIKRLEHMLNFIKKRSDIWLATGLEIAQWYTANYLTAFQGHLAVGEPTMTDRALGMDHAHYAYSPMPKRPTIVWPNGAHLAVCIYLYFEFLEFDQPPGIVRDPRLRSRPRPDCREFSWYEYGNRVGVFRILDALDRYGFKATVAANAEACQRFPYLVDAFRRRGYEIAAHGITASRMVSSAMSDVEERAFIAESLSAVETATGVRPKGWFSQDYNESSRTPTLLAEADLSYLCDWPNDDQPYLMTTVPDLVSLPNHAQWDDLLLLWDRRIQVPRYPAIVGEAFHCLLQEGAASGRFFSLGVHPWLMGAPHRMRYFESALANISAARPIWQATAGEVADHILAVVSRDRSARVGR
jgi:allantoinase